MGDEEDKLKKDTSSMKDEASPKEGKDELGKEKSGKEKSVKEKSGKDRSRRDRSTRERRRRSRSDSRGRSKRRKIAGRHRRRDRRDDRRDSRRRRSRRKDRRRRDFSSSDDSSSSESSEPKEEKRRKRRSKFGDRPVSGDSAAQRNLVAIQQRLAEKPLLRQRYYLTLPSRRLYVGNLPVAVGLDKISLIEFFNTVLMNFGMKTVNPIIEIHMQGSSRFCFLEFRCARDNIDAFQMLQGLTLGECPLKINKTMDYQPAPENLVDFVVPDNINDPVNLATIAAQAKADAARAEAEAAAKAKVKTEFSTKKVDTEDENGLKTEATKAKMNSETEIKNGDVEENDAAAKPEQKEIQVSAYSSTEAQEKDVVTAENKEDKTLDDLNAQDENLD